jgi:hypothetical protein
MRRDPALASLSRDHHQALFVAQRLRRAEAQTAAQAQAALSDYWEAHGREHFRLEEELLLPAYAGFGDPYHPLVARALCDHVAIRQRIDALDGDSAASVDALRELGSLLAEHVRLEERELFPLIEATLPAAPLAELATALDQAHSGS